MTLAALDFEKHLPVTISYPGLTDSVWSEFCAEFPDAMLEYTADGTLIITPATDPETGDRVSLINYRLTAWASETGRGRVTGADASFRFPSGARRAPDAAWRDAARWDKARQAGTTRYPVFAPEFVIELRSPDDKLRLLREKMREYIDDGVQLGWLIDPVQRQVKVYRPNRPPELLSNPASISGEGPVAGFVLDLDGIL